MEGRCFLNGVIFLSHFLHGGQSALLPLCLRDGVVVGMTGKVEGEVTKFPSNCIFATSSFSFFPRDRMTIIGSLGHVTGSKRVSGLTGKGFCGPRGARFNVLGPSSCRVTGSFVRQSKGVVNCVAKCSTCGTLKLAARVSSCVRVNMGGCHRDIGQRSCAVSFIIRPGAVAGGGERVLQVLSTVHFVHRVPNAAPGSTYLQLGRVVGSLSIRRGRLFVGYTLGCAGCIHTLYNTVLRSVNYRDSLLVVVEGSLGKMARCGLPVASSMLPAGQG